jgi:prepilin-type N-terminal cleavage/methylation domain-containing protein
VGGFTLIELLVTLAIVGILASLAQTTFRAGILRTRRMEAIVGLRGIHRAQILYHDANAHYGDTFDDIGFTLDGAESIDERTQKARFYTFTVSALPFDGDPYGNFQAVATGDLDGGDGLLDILLIENHLEIAP